MKIYDCFMFYNEFELLELRLKSYYDIVDYFVLVEADRGHTNIPEPFFFNENKDRFKEFLPKIRHFMVNLNLPYKGTGDWTLEHAHRNSIAFGLKDAEPEDLVFISDLDEFWSPDILQRINNRSVPLFAGYTPPLKNKRIIIPCQLLIHALDFLEVSPISMDQSFHYYYLDWAFKEKWQGTVLTKFKNLGTPQDLRNLRTGFPRIPDGGWHFSYFGDVDRIISKMTTIVDGNELVEKSGGKLIDRKHLEDSMKIGKSMYSSEDITETQFLPYDISKINLPYIQEFIKKYPQFLKTKD